MSIDIPLLHVFPEDVPIVFQLTFRWNIHKYNTFYMFFIFHWNASRYSIDVPVDIPVKHQWICQFYSRRFYSALTMNIPIIVPIIVMVILVICKLIFQWNLSIGSGYRRRWLRLRPEVAQPRRWKPTMEPAEPLDKKQTKAKESQLRHMEQPNM